MEKARRSIWLFVLPLCIPGVVQAALWGQAVPSALELKGQAPIRSAYPEFIESSLPEAMVGVPFHSAVQAVGGEGQLRLTVSGDVPPGLDIETKGSVVEARGVPDTAGTYELEITAVDPYGATATSQYTVHVSPQILGSQQSRPVTIADPEILNVSDADSVFFPAVIAITEKLNVNDAISGVDSAVIVDPENLTLTDTVAVRILNVPPIQWAMPAPINFGTPLNATQLDATSTVSGTFAYSPAAGTILPAGIQTLSVAFTPTDPTKYVPATATVQLVVNAIPIPALSARALSFGSQAIGTASASQSVTLTNNGDAPLSVSGITVTGANAASFAFGNACGSSVAAGASCTIHGHFAPTAVGVLTAAITITDNAQNSPQTVALSGTGAEPPVTLSPTSLTFAPTMVGSASGSQSVTMTNTGTAVLTISSITLTGANASSFVFANTCGASLAGGANCTIHGHFAPTTAGALTAAITITDDAINSPQTIALSGSGGAASVTLSAKSLAFGSVNVGTTSSSQTVTMTNSGTAALSITSIAVTGTNASSFGFANNCGSSLAAGANCTIHGHFGPTAAGAMTAAVTVTDSAATSPQTISLTGTGKAPASPPTLSATSLSFGTVHVGTSSGSQSVTMTNTGTTTLSITSIVVTGANASSFAFANSCGTSLAPGANCSIHGHFAPMMTGALTASITIADFATGSPQIIALSGTGQ